jgi:16S rRNA (uracil1498-N3)-methyltransferase
MRHIPRIYVEGLLFKEAIVTLTPQERRHVGSVLRLSLGDAVRVFNAQSGEWQARITDQRAGTLVCVHQICAAPSSLVGPRLLFPILKGPRLALLIEKAVELGVSILTPIITKYTALTNFHKTRWQAVAKQATEQSGQGRIPSLQDPQDLRALLETWPTDTPLFVGDERIKVASRDVFCKGFPQEASFLVGPEGGFAPEEFAFFSCLPFVQSISLGPTTLRTETAAIALLALYQALKERESLSCETQP